MVSLAKRSCSLRGATRGCCCRVDDLEEVQNQPPNNNNNLSVDLQTCATFLGEEKTARCLRSRCSNTMGQALSGYGRVRHIVKHPVDSFEATRPQREAIHGPCDFVLVVQGTQFNCHKSVLMASSRYFETMLTMFDESTKSEVELKDIVDSQIMALSLHFLYNNNLVPLKRKNVHDILQLAIYLQIQSLQGICCKYLQGQLSKKNCLTVYMDIFDIGPYEFQCTLEDFILQHFEAILSKYSKHLCDLTRPQLCRLLSSDKLLVTSESTVYKAVVTWVNADPENRAMQCEDLLDHVYFTLMSKDEVENCLQSGLVKKSLNLVNKLNEAMDYFDKPTDQKIDYWTSNPKPARWPKILVISRMYWKNLPMEYYDFRSKTWNTLCDVNNWRSCTSMVSHGTCIFFLGGEESDKDSPTGSRTVNRVTRYDCEQKSWISVPSMQLARRWAASIVIDNKIYVIGGIGGKGGTYEKRLDSMEVLDLECIDWKASKRDRIKNGAKWKIVTPMSTPRSSHSVAAVDGIIYVVGGGDGKEWLCSAEAYNTRTQKWASVSSLNIKRWKCGLVALGNSLFAIGGMDSPKAGHWGNPLKTVERYDPNLDKWTEVASMNEARFGSAVVTYQGKIYVIGGFGISKAILNSQECYDPDTDKWTKLTSMKKMCGFVGGTLVDRPVHFEDRPSLN